MSNPRTCPTVAPRGGGGGPFFVIQVGGNSGEGEVRFASHSSPIRRKRCPRTHPHTSGSALAAAVAVHTLPAVGSAVWGRFPLHPSKKKGAHWPSIWNVALTPREGLIIRPKGPDRIIKKANKVSGPLIGRLLRPGGGGPLFGPGPSQDPDQRGGAGGVGGGVVYSNDQSVHLDSS